MSENPFLTASLLPPNATAAERAAESASARLSDIPVNLRDLWNPDTCPESLLPWLAWALGVDTWKPYWPVDIKREITRRAIAIKRSKGTVKSVRDIVATFGSSVALRENWQDTPPGAPHGFQISINVNGRTDSGVTDKLIDDIYNEVRRAKPARSFFSITAGLKANTQLNISGVARPVIYRRLKVSAT